MGTADDGGGGGVEKRCVEGAGEPSRLPGALAVSKVAVMLVRADRRDRGMRER